ncbi:prevent-host-death family protein [Brasilonema sp. UFV-L1]|nr:prevent-host-death family protein [Brasilonema sp. UFV-L1]
MAHQYSIEQVLEHLEQIIQDVEQGIPMQLIRQGERVAVILSATEDHILLREKLGFGHALERFRQEYNVEEANINPDEVFKDVRDNSPGTEVIF